MTAAISPGVAKRRSGTKRSSHACISAGSSFQPSSISVSTPPGATPTARIPRGASSTQEGQAMAEFSEGILIGRPASPEDIVPTALFLASSDSDYMTGQVIMIDGGMVLV